MGWKEEDDSEDDCVIPEQDPEQLQAIMMQVLYKAPQLSSISYQ